METKNTNKTLTVKLNQAEMASVLAALEMFQSYRGGDRPCPLMIEEVATDGFGVKPLSRVEVMELMERIEDAAPYFPEARLSNPALN